jgi:glutamate dehydrogenase (NAD(P)+)
MIVTREAARHLGLDILGTTVAVQGSGNVGNVGSVATGLLPGAGAAIVAVTDGNGGVYDPKGLDVATTLEYSEQHHTIDGLPRSTPLSTEELFALDAYVVIPAALENQTNMDNASSVRA